MASRVVVVTAERYDDNPLAANSLLTLNDHSLYVDLLRVGMLEMVGMLMFCWFMFGADENLNL